MQEYEDSCKSEGTSIPYPENTTRRNRPENGEEDKHQSKLAGRTLNNNSSLTVRGVALHHWSNRLPADLKGDEKQRKAREYHRNNEKDKLLAIVLKEDFDEARRHGDSLTGTVFHAARITIEKAMLFKYQAETELQRNRMHELFSREQIVDQQKDIARLKEEVAALKARLGECPAVANIEHREISAMMHEG